MVDDYQRVETLCDPLTDSVENNSGESVFQVSVDDPVKLEF